jgi:hypothetical protein
VFRVLSAISYSLFLIISHHLQQLAVRMTLQHVLTADGYVTSYLTIRRENEYRDLGDLGVWLVQPMGGEVCGSMI